MLRFYLFASALSASLGRRSPSGLRFSTASLEAPTHFMASAPPRNQDTQDRSRHALSTASLGRNGSKAPCGRHMPEFPYIACATAPSVPLPRGLQHRSKSSAHIFYPSQDRSVNACTATGTRLHPSLRVSTDVSTASFTIARHLHLLPKSKRSLACLIF